jgi:hypothetical protein
MYLESCAGQTMMHTVFFLKTQKITSSPPLSPPSLPPTMSSWDRSRSISWSLVRQDGRDPDAYKEQVFKSLQKQMMEAAHEDDATMVVETGEQEKNNSVPYSTESLLKMAAFGGTIGSITGAVFGFMDSMRTAGESTVLQKASNTAKARYLMEGTTRSATVFGLFFGGFHVVS